MKLLSFFLVCPLLIGATYAQSVVISKKSNANPAASAILDVQSTEKGMLVPRMTKAQRDGISSPSSGLLIYQTNDSPGFYYHNGSSWEALKSNESGGITEETDPQVDDNLATNAIPRWDGEKLVSSKITESGDETVFRGTMKLLDSQGKRRLQFDSEGNGVTAINLYSRSDKGIIGLYEQPGGQGHIIIKGPNGKDNVSLNGLGPNNTNDNGFIGVYNENGDIRGQMYSNGETGVLQISHIQGVDKLIATTIEKQVSNFVEDHPLDPTKQIVYACVEGPEAAMYMRGTAKLENGKAIINLPEHYRVLAVESSMTVHVTPLSEESNGLAVTTKSLENGIVVKELMKGTGSYAFDWEVKCVRRGFEDYQVVRDKANTNAFLGGTQD
ncbi:MAG: hypothetical protein RIG62_00555 [Cyclobacteriaceae bacterium]